MTAVAAAELRRLDRAAVQPLLPQLSAWLLPDAIYGVQHTWPQLYRSDGDGRFYGLFRDGALVSHCAWRAATVRTAAGPLRVGLLGSVATEPLERGHGHASRLLSAAIADARADGLDAILLWAERVDLYARVGFVAGTTERCAVIDALDAALPPGTAVRLATVADHARLTALHAAKPAGVERSPRVMSLLLTTPGMWTCVLERDGAVTAYACIGKGADLQNWWHELGGSDADVATLLPAAMQMLERSQSIALLPPYRQDLLRLLTPRCAETAELAGPMQLSLAGSPLPPLWIDGLDSV